MPTVRAIVFMNILIVDDQRVMREISKAIVSEMGHTALEAENGEMALGVTQLEKVDLILLDVEMPGINGFKTAEIIRSLHKNWFPIIFLSAKTDTEFFVEGIRSGGDAYLYKPVVPEVLESMVRSMERIVTSQEELHRAKVNMELLAHRDALTGLVNRRGFDNAIQLEFDKAKQDKSPLTLMMLDVDHFKKFNDHYGHQAGDDCLKLIAKQLKKALCRERDIIARYGGEEFAMILPDTTLENAQVVAQRVIDCVAEAQIPHEHSDTASNVTVSGGMVQLGEHASVKELIEDADQRLYQAKEGGRNKFCW